mgnify:CR=1 FL=1
MAAAAERAAYRPAPWWNRASYRVFWFVVGGAIRVLFRLRIENRPRLRGPAVLVANHASFIDPMVLGAASWRRIRFMMASMHYDSPRGNWFYRWHRAISVSLTGANRESLRTARASLEAGEIVGVFPEGGLTRTGLLREPKFGLLSYMIAGFDETRDRDVVFVPVGINYDRVIEDRVLTHSRKTQIGKRTFQFGIGKVFGFVWNLIVLRYQGKLYRYGYACASFGEPVSLKDWLKRKRRKISAASPEQKFALIEKFGTDLMQDVGKVIPVLPVALVSSVFESSGQEAMTELELKSRCFELSKELEANGAHLYIPREDRDYAVGAGLRMLTLRHLVIEEDGCFRASPDEGELITYYANSIRHLLA